MRYIRIDENLPDHPKFQSIPKRYRVPAIGLYVAACCYSSRLLTDGFIPAGFFGEANAKQLLQHCVEVGLFEQAKNGFMVHDYLEYNKSKKQIEELREVKKTAGQKGGKASGKARRKQTRSKVVDVSLSKTKPTTDKHLEGFKVLSSDKPLKAQGVDLEVLGYFEGKVRRELTQDDLNSLGVLCKTYPPSVVTLAIGQAVAQGEAADNFALITTIAKAEVSR